MTYLELLAYYLVKKREQSDIPEYMRVNQDMDDPFYVASNSCPDDIFPKLDIPEVPGCPLQKKKALEQSKDWTVEDFTVCVHCWLRKAE